MRDFPPTHPGEILLEEFLKPMGITQYRIAKDIGVPAMRINKIVRCERGISADTALRWHIILECRLISGLGFRFTMIQKWLKCNWVID